MNKWINKMGKVKKRVEQIQEKMKTNINSCHILWINECLQWVNSF